jgi:hypothetical protein
MQMPPRRGGPANVSRLLSYSPHAICKANQNLADTRPPHGMRKKRKERGPVNESKKVRIPFQKDVSKVVRH